MKVAIVSDIHDNLVNLKKCLDVCKTERVGQMICCGDVTNAETLNFLSKNFKDTIHLVRGNAEIFKDKEAEEIKNIIYYGRIGNFEISGKNVGLCHEPFLFDKVLEKGKCEIVFYGHTHKPWIETKKNVRFLNPGTVGAVFQKATFSIWDIEKGQIDLKILDLF